MHKIVASSKPDLKEDGLNDRTLTENTSADGPGIDVQGESTGREPADGEGERFVEQEEAAWADVSIFGHVDDGRGEEGGDD
ncbi:hypothetical protein DICSQDRAFT_173155 [Dichomitus squalens LYAD-421 SS1]|uniref:Uncharacterized protein n=1 Tax=Dichomitus squalens (strain LYAD-421) TaxID=732165 RepID=R7STB7_DICSQ|nr:uncharacterized protein DICSQDRAFT_173155 [Dichomitus squalens LYAD-421 SS1]EJF58197.1 hypothetical protein DICSQDRAFT_173155 [Dichomitus squalens LYAD-421 SS1]